VSQTKAAEQVLRFVAEAGVELSASLDYVTTMATVARLAVPSIADWCVLRRFEDEGPSDELIVRVSESISVSDALAHEFAEQRFFWDGPCRAEEAVRTGAPTIVSELGAVAKDAWESERMQHVAAQLAPTSCMAVPLVARDRALGVLQLFSTNIERPLGARQLALAEELGRRAAQALDNALLYRDAEEAIRVRDEFLSIASHELKTPLTPLMLHIQGLRRATQVDMKTPQSVRSAA
jgi:GAF domain-containing protein